MSDQSSGQTRVFNPNDHLIQLRSREGSKDYLPVQWRLVWFREQCPLGTIDTEELEVNLDREVEEEVYIWNSEKRRSEKVVKHGRGYARYRAVVTDGKGGRATGTKTENAASFPDFVEKAETGAIGRALAALGYGTQFAPDLDEAHRIVDSPVDRSSNNSGYHNGNGDIGTVATARPGVVASNGTRPVDSEKSAATEQQLSSIRKLSEHLGKPAPEEGSLSFLGAKKLIQQLTAEYREMKQNSKAS